MAHFSGRRSGYVAALALALVVVLSLLATGCGASTPEQAVRDFLESIQENDWYGYLSSILPERVREMTGEDERLRRESFDESKQEFSEIKLKVEPDEEDKNRADVIMESGKVSYEDPETGKKTTESIESVPVEYRTIKTQKFKGSWYVDVQLASQAPSM